MTEQTTTEYCDRCDGCGWYEGGPTIQTRCEKCNGTGVVRRPMTELELAARRLADPGEVELPIAEFRLWREKRERETTWRPDHCEVEQARFFWHEGWRAARKAQPAPAAQPAAAEASGRELLNGKTPWEFACEWYGVSEIVDAVKRDMIGALDVRHIPANVHGEEFGKWLCHEYRLAMRKGIEIGMRGTRPAEPAAAASGEAERLRAELARLERRFAKLSTVGCSCGSADCDPGDCYGCRGHMNVILIEELNETEKALESAAARLAEVEGHLLTAREDLEALGGKNVQAFARLAEVEDENAGLKLMHKTTFSRAENERTAREQAEAGAGAMRDCLSEWTDLRPALIRDENRGSDLQAWRRRIADLLSRSEDAEDGTAGRDYAERLAKAEAEVAELRKESNDKSRLFDHVCDQVMRDVLFAIAGAVCTPEKGYKNDGGFNQMVADIKRLRQQHDQHAADLASNKSDRDKLALELARMGAALRELIRDVEPMLIEVEPLRWEQKQAIEDACDAKRKWADDCNSRCAPGEQWYYMAEFRQALERKIEPLALAVRTANAAWERARAVLQPAPTSPDSPGEAK